MAEPRSTAEPQPTASPQSRRWHATLAALGVTVLLTVCGLGSYLIMKEERQDTDLLAEKPTPIADTRNISSRDVDPEPLTAEEVFPASELTIDGTPQAYQIVKAEATTDCRTATEGELQKLITSLECSQVVRATLHSPTKEYLITGGVLNLATEEGARQAREQITSMVERDEGRFLGFVTGKETEPLALPIAHVGWDIRGHYLIYGVIARADGLEFEDNDPFAKQILFDIVDLHLRDSVLEKRASGKD